MLSYAMWENLLEFSICLQHFLSSDWGYIDKKYCVHEPLKLSSLSLPSLSFVVMLFIWNRVRFIFFFSFNCIFAFPFWVSKNDMVLELPSCYTFYPIPILPSFSAHSQGSQSQFLVYTFYFFMYRWADKCIFS